MARPVKFRGKWRIRWIDDLGRRRSEVFDEFARAQRELRERQYAVDEVKRGLRAPEPPEKTFGELCDYWLENRAPQKRSAHHDVSIIRAHLRPALGAVRLRDLGTSHADRFTVERAHLSQKTLANLLTLLLSMLNVAVDLGWLLKAPRIRKPKVRIFDADFSYLRTREEVTRFLRASREESLDVHDIYATAVFTGLRAGELGGLRWDDVNFERRVICVQRSFDGPTKAGDVRYVPLMDPLLVILRDRRLRTPGLLVFTNETGGMLQPSSRIYQEVLHRVIDAAGFPRIERRGKSRRYIVFHDLRHSFASHWVMTGGDLFKLQKVLGHKTVAMTQRYAHLAPDAFVDDLARFEGYEASPSPAAVLRLRP